MDFETLVQTRKSVRGFKKQAVPRAVIEEIIDVAKRAPSSMNTQPWHVHVLTGAPLEEVRRRNVEEMAAGARPKRDIVSHGEYQGAHRVRQVDIAKKLFAAMGIARDDKPMRQDWVLRGFRQFDAPVSMVLTYDRELDPGAVVHFDPQDSMVYAVVHGSEDYVVRMELSGREIRCTCTCPFFNDNQELCKHLWAVALTCDSRRVLQPPDSIGKGLVVLAVPLTQDPEEDWTSDDPEFHVPARTQTRGGRPVGTAKPPAWQQALTAIASRATTARIARPDPPAGQILYVIDLAASRQASNLSVHLLRQEQRQSGETGAKA